MLAGAVMAALMVAMTGVASAQDEGCKGDIVLDPGHGGADTGAVNNTYDGLITEKAETLKVALDLKDLLIKDHYDVCMTRTTNEEPSPTTSATPTLTRWGRGSWSLST